MKVSPKWYSPSLGSKYKIAPLATKGRKRKMKIEEIMILNFEL
jgi:hypothetical protein